MFEQQGMAWNMSDHLWHSLQKFTCAMYCSNSGTSDINELFFLKRGHVESSRHQFCIILWVCGCMRICMRSPHPSPPPSEWKKCSIQHWGSICDVKSKVDVFEERIKGHFILKLSSMQNRNVSGRCLMKSRFVWTFGDFCLISELNKDFQAIWLVERFLI